MRTRRALFSTLVCGLLAACSAGGAEPGSRPAPDDSAPVASQAPVYWIVAPDEAEEPGRLAMAPGRRLVAGNIGVDHGEDPAVAAIRALITTDDPGPGLRNAPLGRFGDRFEVLSVEHDDGLVTVDLTADPYDPCPVCGIVLPAQPRVILQQYVLTAQAAFGTNDPVLFTARGEPVQGLWFARVRGPVRGDPDLVVERP